MTYVEVFGSSLFLVGQVSIKDRFGMHFFLSNPINMVFGGRESVKCIWRSHLPQGRKGFFPLKIAKNQVFNCFLFCQIHQVKI